MITQKQQTELVDPLDVVAASLLPVWVVVVHVEGSPEDWVTTRKDTLIRVISYSPNCEVFLVNPDWFDAFNRAGEQTRTKNIGINLFSLGYMADGIPVGDLLKAMLA